jgi:proteasome accessory factor C
VSAALQKRLQRLLMLLAAAARAERSGKGVPLARAVAITGARSEQEVLADVESARGLWDDPGVTEDVVDLYVEDGQVHVTYGHTFGTPPPFSLTEGAALLSALTAVDGESNRALATAVRKLRKCIPEQVREQAEALAQGVDLAPVPAGPWAGALRDAIERRLETVIEYRGVADADAARRTVEPRLLFHRDGQWYLAAWNVAKAEEHLFRLDRAVQVEVGTRVFERHQGPPVGRYARRTLYFDSGAERDVTLRFTGAAARLARQRFGARAQEQLDGGVTVTTRLTPGNYLFGLVLGHGGDATVEAPADASAAFRERVDELARLYR